MSANNYDWAQALSASPGSQLAALQARQYESETTQRMMTKFDEAVMTMTAGITDPTELQAAQMRAADCAGDAAGPYACLRVVLASLQLGRRHAAWPRASSWGAARPPLRRRQRCRD